jgi:hypothetical protein
MIKFNLRRKQMKSTFSVLSLFIFLPVFSYGDLVWPMSAGVTWEYTAYPTDGGASWTLLTQFEEATFDSKLYYSYRDSFFRSTENEIYEWDFDLGTETLLFQIAPIGTTWNHSTDNTVEIVDIGFRIEEVYGSPYEDNTYKLKFTDSKGTWYIYVVLDVGIVRWDEYDEVPPYDLLWTDIPEPASLVLLCLGGLVLRLKRSR